VHRNNKQITVVIPVHSSTFQVSLIQNIFNSLSNLPFKIVFVADSFLQCQNKDLAQLMGNYEGLDIILIDGVFNSPGESRNAGIRVSTTTWICFWDGDDNPIPKNFLKMRDYGEAKNLDAVIGSFELIKNDYNSVENILKERNQIQTIDDFYLNPAVWRVIFRRSSIELISFTAFRMGEDQCFISDFLHTKPRIEYLNIKCYQYVVGNNFQLTANQLSMREIVKSFHYVYANKRTNHLSSKEFDIVCLFRLYLSAIRKIKGLERLEMFMSLTPKILKTTFLYPKESLGTIILISKVKRVRKQAEY
jgi:glycosyltransferase involved in cell wall biosynthesis